MNQKEKTTEPSKGPGDVSDQKEKVHEPSKGPGGVSEYAQTHLSDKKRISPEEDWMWEFEDGFLNPFIDIGVNIVDRATIMRLTAADSGQQGSAYNPIAVKKIEMDSLKGKADLFIEILICFKWVRKQGQAPFC